MYRETYTNGVKTKDEEFPYSLLDQNGSYAPVPSATYTNVWNGTWTIKKDWKFFESDNHFRWRESFWWNIWSEIDAWNQLCWDNKYRFKFGKTLMMKELGYPSSFFIIIKSLNPLYELERLPYQQRLNHS